MRSLGAAVLVATSLIVSTAFAATATDNTAPLAPGKPAGVKQAAMHGHWLWWGGALGVAGLGAALVASGNGSNNITTTTTTSTNP